MKLCLVLDTDVIFKGFWWGLVVSRAHSQERILETSLVQNGGFIEAKGQDPRAERAVAPGLWGATGPAPWRLWKVELRRVQKGFSYAEEDPQDTGGLALVKTRLFSPPARHEGEDRTFWRKRTCSLPRIICGGLQVIRTINGICVSFCLYHTLKRALFKPTCSG